MKQPLPKLTGHRCFACGTENPIGLNMNFYREGNRICSDITLSEDYVGWSRIAHGGIITTLLDEAMSWSLIASGRLYFLTREIKVKYLKPVYVGTPLKAWGEVKDADRTSSIKMTGGLEDQSGTTLARSEGLFAELPKEKLPFLPEDLVRDMETLYCTFPRNP
ncbi:MAG: PaaI family thioesterase [Deltaproteobacteria bacterium]|nr:PaaI family thioesterase [Deltaproteobacteria bacterium]